MLSSEFSILLAVGKRSPSAPCHKEPHLTAHMWQAAGLAQSLRREQESGPTQKPQSLCNQFSEVASRLLFAIFFSLAVSHGPHSKVGDYTGCKYPEARITADHFRGCPRPKLTFTYHQPST